MSNQSHSSNSSRSSSQPRNTKRQQRERRKKNSEDYYSQYEDDDGSQFDDMRQKKNSTIMPGISKLIKRENKLKKPNLISTPVAATFLYKPGAELPNLSNYINQIIEIRIACEYVNRNNQALILRQIWGSNGVYASHSDAVCVGIHAGLLALGDIKLTGSQLYQGVSLSCKVIKGKKSLNGQIKTPLLSRSLKTPCAHCLKPEKVQWLQQLGSPEQLINWAKKMSLPSNRRLTKRSHYTVFLHEPPQNSYPENLLINNLPPLNEGWIIWDMCNEPSQKYNLLTFMDRQTSQGIKNRTSYKLRTHCLYIETHNKKYEISMDSRYINEEVFLNSNAYMIQEIIQPQKSEIEILQREGVPMPQDRKRLIMDKLRWDKFEWGNDNVIIDGKFTIQGLKSFKLVPITKHQHYQQ